MTLLIPCNDQFEKMILSSAIVDIAAADFVFLELVADNFLNPSHILLFSICKKLYAEGKPIDLAIIINELKVKDKLKELSINDLMKIAQYGSPGLDCSYYIQELKNLTALRKIIATSQMAIANSAKVDAVADDVIDQIQENLLSAQNGQAEKSRNMNDIIDHFRNGMNFEDHLEWMIQQRRLGKPPYEGISSGFPLLDETLGFFRNSCLYYIGARTSMGKTTFILNLINNMKKHPIGFFSLEMPKECIIAKILCIAADVKYSHYEDGILYPEKAQRLKEAQIAFKDSKIYIEDPGAITISQLRSRAKRMKLTYGIEILFIDYITRVQGSDKKKSKHLEIDEVSKGLQCLAKELRIPIICLAQLNRASANNTKQNGNTPCLTDFRESGSIEEDADACILLHRPEYYDPKNKPGIIHAQVAKNRLRGTIKKIEFSCDSFQSDRYHELKNIAEDLPISKPNTFMEDIMNISYEE